MKRKYSEDETQLRDFEANFDSASPAFYEVETYEFVVNQYLDRGDLAKASTVLQAALKQHPYSSNIMVLEAQRRSLEGNYTGALDMLEEAKNFNPSDFETLIAEAMIHNRHSEHKKALESIESTNYFFALPAEANLALGLAHKGLCDYQKAATCLEAFMAEDGNGNDDMVAMELAECYEFLGNDSKAKRLFLSIIDDDPYCENAWYDLGLLYLKNQEEDKAIEALEFASIINDDFCLAHLALGRCYLFKDKVAAALDTFKKILTSSFKDSQTLCMVGEELYQAEQLKEAAKYFKVATDQDEREHRAWYGIGRCLLERGKCFEAIHFLKKSLDIDAKEPYVWLDLALAEASVGNDVSSYMAFENASSRGPEIVDVWVQWAKLSINQNDASGAVDIIRQGLEFIPDCPELVYSLSACLILDGKYKDAIVYLERALILDYEKHILIFDFFPDLETQKRLFNVVEHYRPS